MKAMSILTDTTRCIGCEKCVVACKEANHTGEDKLWRWQRKINDLSASRWTTIITAGNSTYVRQQCRHCLEPACVSVCPVGALQRTPEGPVIYNGSICMGCRYCMMACPYGIPRYLWSENIPYVRKCTMCYENIKSGKLKQPACTHACPEKATIFGEREELLEIARKRLAEAPERYGKHGKIWGEFEVGGTSVMYLSDADLSFLGWKKELGKNSLPHVTWKTLRTVPYTFLGVGAAMLGVHWVIGRRMRNDEESIDSVSSNSDDSNGATGSLETESDVKKEIKQEDDLSQTEDKKEDQ